MLTFCASAVSIKYILTKDKRSIDEFVYDTVKQVLGGLCVYGVNILISENISEYYCSWHLLQMFLDTTLCTFIEWNLLWTTTNLFQWRFPQLSTGQYTLRGSFILQATLWCTIVAMSKCSLLWMQNLFLYDMLLGPAASLLKALEEGEKNHTSSSPYSRHFIDVIIPFSLYCMQFIATDCFFIWRRSPPLWRDPASDIEDDSSENELNAVIQLCHSHRSPSSSLWSSASLYDPGSNRNSPH